jgi:L-ascorbate metabolism protein UlaG (beta-lactamase superfamily)
MKNINSKILLLGLMFLLGGWSFMKSDSQTQTSDHFDGTHFFNPWGHNNTKSFFDVMKWKISTTPSPWPEKGLANTAVPQLVENGKAASVHITYIGHATTYIQSDKVSVLTDPQFSDRSSPVSFAGPTRVRKPALEIEKLPALDFVIISHNHYDHLDLPSLLALEKKFHPHFIVPLGNAELLKSEGIQKVTELDWWQSAEGFQLVPAQHWSARGMWDRNKTLWGGYVFELDKQKIFFAGDTGYGPHFKMIREKCGPMDISILPIGAYEPRWFMKDQHMNPDDAVLAHLDLGSHKSFAIHFETFQMTDEAFDEPRKTLQTSLVSHQLKLEDFFIPQVGETLIIK